jgi:hypothetical protein
MLISAIALSNLQSIFEAEKDFVVGSLLSLVGFCFGKALSRTQEENALQMIRAGSNLAVEAALQEKFLERLNAQGFPQEVALLRNNVDASIRNLLDHHDKQASMVRMCRDINMVNDVLGQLDRVLSSVINLQKLVGEDVVEYRVSDRWIHSLPGIHRDIKEAVNRRDQVYELLRGELDPETHTDIWEIFAVMTSDILKAVQLLEGVLKKNVLTAPETQLRVIVGYLRAGIRRARNFEEAVAETAVRTPQIFTIMVEDLVEAHRKLEELTEHDLLPEGGVTPLVSPRAASESGVSM